MRSKEIIASIAVVGAVATFALFNVNIKPSTNFLSMGNPEAAFADFAAKYGKSYGTKAEFNYRQGVFMDNYHKIMHHNMMNSEEEGFNMELN